MNGKGDKPRPILVDRDTYSSNWDNIFNKKKTVPDAPDGFWTHDCFEIMAKVSVQKGQECNFCAKNENSIDSI